MDVRKLRPDQVGHQQLERRYAQLIELGRVGRAGHVGEQAGVHPGVQRLDSPVEHFGEASVGAQLDDWNPLLAQRFSGAARGDQLDSSRGERFRKLSQA